MKKLSSAVCVFLLTASLSCGDKGGSGPNPPPPPAAPPDAQPPTVTITSPGGGAFLDGTVSIVVSAQDNVAVTKVEVLLDGVVAATATSPPWNFTWDTNPLSDGTRNLVARAYDGANNQGVSPVVSVTIRHPFELTFHNLVHTDISLTVQNQTSPLPVPAGGSRTYTYQSNPGTVAFSGTTSGKTSSGTQVGLQMSWGSSFPGSGLRTGSVDLFLSGTYFFIRLQNCGSVINGVYVNYGLVNQTYDNISVPGDCLVKLIGYYRAFTNTQVRAYRSSTTYTYWDQGTHFTLPFTNNQSVTLRNDFFGTAIAGSAGSMAPSQLPQRADELSTWLTVRPAAQQVAGRALD